MSEGNGFTPTQKAMLKILSDGKRHRLAELKTCCGPCSDTTVASHVYLLKKKLVPKGEDIVCVFSRGYFYQHVRMLYAPVPTSIEVR